MFGDGFYVCFVAITTDHDNSCTELGVYHGVSDYFYGAFCGWDLDLLALVFGVARVLWIDGNRDAGGYEFRTSRGNSQVATRL